MPTRYDTYGFQELDLDQAAQYVEQALGLSLEERYSDYYPGGSYRNFRLATGRGIKLYRNRLAGPEAWQHEEFKPYGVIMLVEDLDDMDDVRRKLAVHGTDPVLLRSTSFPDVPESGEEGFW